MTSENGPTLTMQNENCELIPLEVNQSMAILIGYLRGSPYTRVVICEDGNVVFSVIQQSKSKVAKRKIKMYVGYFAKQDS